MKQIIALLLLLGMYISPVKAEPTIAQPLTYLPSTSISVGTTSGQFLASGVYTRVLEICTLPSSTSNVWIDPSGGTAAVGSGLLVAAGGGCLNFGGVVLPIPTAAITAITDGSSAQSVSVGGG